MANDTDYTVYTPYSITDLPPMPTSSSPSIVEAGWFNAIWFQSLWFLTVLGRDPMLLGSIALLVLHLALVRKRRKEMELLATVAIIGITVDTGLSLANVFIFPHGSLIPLWLCCLWLAMAAALPRSLAFLQRHAFLPVLAGAVVIPLNYWAGARLGAVEFGYPLPQTLLVLSLVWALLLPVLLRIVSDLAPQPPTATTP
jgi:hypothetical protein